MAAAGPVLSIEGLEIHAESPIRKPLVRGVDIQIGAGEVFALIGESGSGKTLSALAVLGLLPAQLTHSAGNIRLREASLQDGRYADGALARGRDVAIIFQDAASSFNPVFRIGHQIQDVLCNRFRIDRKAARSRILELFDRVQLQNPDAAFRAYPHELSGGMIQRAMIAMALGCKPAVLIADEPTTGLDARTQQEIVELLRVLQADEGFAVWLISHDIALVAALAATVAVIRQGQIVERGAVSAVLRNPEHSYTRTLLAAQLPGVDAPAVELPSDAELEAGHA